MVLEIPAIKESYAENCIPTNASRWHSKAVLMVAIASFISSVVALLAASVQFSEALVIHSVWRVWIEG